LPASIIDTALALKVLEPIWTKTTETASRVRQRCEQVIAWATVRQYREGANPFVWRGQLDTLLPKPSVLKKRKHEQNGGAHHPSIPYAELPAFMAELRRNRFVSARALEFAILTATRTNEVVKATWDEIDLATKTWTIPAVRMKAGKEHRVPLSPRAFAILSDLAREDGNPHIFIGAKSGQPLSNLAMLQLMKVLRPKYVPHGFRSTFRTWAAETTGYPHDVCEQALAHTIRNAVERAYQHSDLFDKRRKLMAAWADYCAAPVAAATAKVTPLRRKAKS
jgi:integrase